MYASEDKCVCPLRSYVCVCVRYPHPHIRTYLCTNTNTDSHRGTNRGAHTHTHTHLRWSTSATGINSGGTRQHLCTRPLPPSPPPGFCRHLAGNFIGVPPPFPFPPPSSWMRNALKLVEAHFDVGGQKETACPAWELGFRVWVLGSFI